MTRDLKSAVALGRLASGPSQSGQGLVEYALIIVLVAIGVVLALTALGGQLQTIFNTIVNNLSSVS
jgi:pilus assembly protein Flp/PilA